MTQDNRPTERRFDAEANKYRKIEAAALKLKALRKGATVGALHWRKLRDEGRK